MLLLIDIQDVAVIKRAKIEFSDGLSVLTGETGAGKSIILDAIGMICGNRTGREIIRSGCEKAKVSALFYVETDEYDRLSEFGIEKTEDNTLLIQRELSSDGRGTVRINGSLSSVAILKEIGARLINIHGQQDTATLYSPERHIHILDEFSGMDKIKLKEFSEIFGEFNRLKKEAEEFEELKSRRAAETDLLEYRINEITALNLKENEESELKERAELLENSEEIMNFLVKAADLLSENRQNAVDMVNDSVGALAKISEYSGELSALYEQLCDASYRLKDISRNIKYYAEDIDFSPNELADIHDRLDEINRICVKYRCSSDSLNDVLKESEEKLDNLKNTETLENNTRKKLEFLSDELNKKAEELHKIRLDAAEKFESAMEKNLADLNMSGTKFKAVISETKFNPHGKDTVQFMISANVGEDLKPLAKAASGGELSRIMLSLKTLDTEKGKTYIFDEIDTGVSGITAEKIAAKLTEVSKHNQTLIITHSPQIAAAADCHYLIEKISSETETAASVTMLTPEERVAELARIAAGSNITTAALEAAKELLNRKTGDKH